MFAKNDCELKPTLHKKLHSNLTFFSEITSKITALFFVIVCKLVTEEKECLQLFICDKQILCYPVVVKSVN